MIAGGIGMAVAGAVLMTRTEPHPEWGFVAVPKHPGAPVLLGVGAALTVVGVAPLTVGLCNLRRARRGEGCLRSAAAEERTHVRPWGGRGLAGLSIHRRF